jgi:DNA-binding CsgD family transcriptional regulator
LSALVTTVSRVHQARGEFDRVRALSTWAWESHNHTAATYPEDELSLRELSDAERRVAALAARGHSNREIGSRLYVTTSTVEQHLTRVYRKLGVAGRGQLPVELAT